MWAAVAAFIGPLVAAIAASAGWFAWLERKRKEFIQAMINQALSALEARLLVVERAIADQTRHLDKQDDALGRAMESIARIEGRLMQSASPPQ